ncbi:lipase family protein [Simiduia sp. 21SJ11W-1]|uniref:lipase family protein n=1 Tax=Simiduia sp. 21SJ11W-1 TaxID=2909669 RepID=UPI0020A0383F|nr:lipase family protein [Simiduia sp. 21SJ11W-1]UTA48629.1 lipase family protein [Simiduia sp. 21SJ11W-1]
MELEPTIAAKLASGVYSVNSGNNIELRAFLKRKPFSSAQAPTKLTAEIGGRIFRSCKDAFGVCAVGGGEHEGDAFLVFRGTTTANNKADFVTDARIGITLSKAGLPVHIGFNHAFNSMLPDIKQFLSSNKIMGQVHCIGHSLGGAVASLAADWVKRNTAHPVKLYTFGAPRVGTEWFATSTSSTLGQSNIHRTYHKTDPVPMVALYPFMHAPVQRQGHYIPSAQPLTSGDAHRMLNYRKSVEGKSWAQLNETPEEPYTVQVFVEQWLRSKSPVDPHSASFWRWLESAVIYVLKKIAMGLALSLQATFMGGLTLADKIAWILAKGIDLSEHISDWVEHLMRKMMQALGMQVASGKKALTQRLMRQVLQKIMEKAHREARNALRKNN